MFALLDLEKFYTGAYVDTGGIVSDNVAPTLPPIEDKEMALAYKYDYHDITNIVHQPKTQLVPLLDEATGEQVLDEITGEPIMVEENVLDENGEIVYEDITVTTSVLEWFFVEEKYNAILEEKLNKTPKATTNEKIEELTTMNNSLNIQINDLTNTVVMVSMMIP